MRPFLQSMFCISSDDMLAVLLFLLQSIAVRSEIPDLNDDQRPPCPCGSNSSSIQSRVVGGHNAGRGHFPYASCLISDQLRMSQLSPFCGATLISDSHVVTAAHCVKNREPDDILVDIGDYDLKDDQGPILRRATSIAHFPEYKPGTFHTDIAVVEFAGPVPWWKGARAAFLPPPQLHLEPGTVVSVYGWGRLQYDGGHPRTLQSLDMPVWERERCQRKFKSRIEPTMMCAGGEEGHDACIGDSGSGLVVRLGNEFVLCGVVSFGRRCAMPHVPGVYTRVSSFVDWIYNRTLSSQCRPCIYGETEPELPYGSSPPGFKA